MFLLPVSRSLLRSSNLLFSISNNFRPRFLSKDVDGSLLSRLKNDVKDAMKNKDQLKLNVIRGLLSDVTYASKSPTSKSFSASDHEVYTIINRAIKRRQESIAQFTQANRLDLVENESSELLILNSYLPQQMSVQEIELEVVKFIDQLDINDVGIKDLGKIMKELNLDSAKAPKKVVVEVVKKVLSSQKTD
ncbi:Yqey-like protein [Gigaspora rosea]|uniref:Altered inheritance of mitochondria protein 41 n=1 Tax=Gigaspora rosea TaxID=44941 RepID=A0A397UMJ9_9GLOM|nr:Yqey-like protein [Gigaspora rosea]